MKLRHYLQYMIGFASALVIGSAQASTVVYEDFGMITEPMVYTTPFEISEAGTYRAKLVDFEYPDVFEILSLAVTQELAPLGIGFGTGSFTFNVPTPGILQAHLAAIPGKQGPGLFGLEIMAVPLPPAAVLFFSGILGLVVVARRDKGFGLT